MHRAIYNHSGENLIHADCDTSLFLLLKKTKMLLSAHLGLRVVVWTKLDQTGPSFDEDRNDRHANRLILNEIGSSGRTRIYNPSVNSCESGRNANCRQLRLILISQRLETAQQRLSAIDFEGDSLKESPKYSWLLLGSKPFLKHSILEAKPRTRHLGFTIHRYACRCVLFNIAQRRPLVAKMGGQPVSALK
jgi:hypothetical protein